MRKLPKRAAPLLLLSVLMSGCSTVGQPTEPMCKSAALCKNLGIVKPSRKLDTISDPTAQIIADNNIAIEQACGK